MKTLSSFNSVLILTIIYFLVTVVFSFYDFADYPLLHYGIGGSRIPLLILIYFLHSHKKNIIYLSALVLFYFAYIMFSETSPERSFYGSIISLIYRFLIFLLVFKSVKNKNWFALFLASIPYLFIYSYFILLINEFLNEDIYPWILNGLLTSLIGGVALYNYIFEDENKNFWLLISSILFVIQIGTFFINKYYLDNPELRTLTIILFGASNFTFYKFMILDEERENVLSVE
jgi:hypothetical protein